MVDTRVTQTHTSLQLTITQTQTIIGSLINYKSKKSVMFYSQWVEDIAGLTSRIYLQSQ